MISIDIGIQVYKSGIPAQYLSELGKRVLQMENLELVGLHFHGGRHDAGQWYWEELMKEYAALIADLKKAGTDGNRKRSILAVDLPHTETRTTNSAFAGCH